MQNVTHEDYVRAADGHAQSHRGIGSLGEAASWRGRALGLIETGNDVRSRVVERVSEVGGLLVDAKQQAASRPFWQRLFSTPQVKAAKHELSQLAAAEAAVKARLHAMGELLDQLPTTDADRKSRIAELKLAKKELMADKKALAADMRDVKTAARRKSVEAGTSFTALATDRKYVAADRRSIAASKERQLQPLEGQRQSIERRIIEIDREILRLTEL